MKTLLKACLLALCSISLLAPLAYAGEDKLEFPVHVVDVNSADVEELTELPGIGQSKAEAIVAYRESHGPFRSMDDLQNIKGIGPKIAMKLKAHVNFGQYLADNSSGE